MAIFSVNLRTQVRRDVLNGAYDASFERRFGLKLGTIAAAHKARQVIEGADDIVDKGSISVVASGEKSDFQKSLQREDSST